ncbi:MAG: DUF58 domain-containing protein [Candidatus Pristimantibacillus sp.]
MSGHNLPSSALMDNKEALALLFPDLSLLARLENLSVKAGSRIKGTMAGKRRSSSLGGSQEFADYRPYAPGDDIRRLDWNVYGRTGRAYMRQYWDEQELNISLYVDISRSMSFGDEESNKRRYALRLAACIGYAALSGEDRATIKLFGGGQQMQELQPLRGRGASPQLFRFLAEAMLSDNEDSRRDRMGGVQDVNEGRAAISMADAFQSERGRPRRAGTTWLITDAMYEQGIEETLLTLIASGQQVVFLHLLSPEEVDPSLAGERKLIDSELGTGKEVALGHQILSNYKKAVRDYQSELQQLCGEIGVIYLFVNTGNSLADTVQQTLLREGVLQSKA